MTTWTGTTLGIRFPDPDPDVAQGFAGDTLWGLAALRPDHAGLFGIEATTHYLPVVTPRYRREIDGRPLRWITRDAAIFNGRFDILDRPTYVAQGLPWAPVILNRKDIGLVIVENAGALPRAFVTTPRFVDGGPAALAALATRPVARGQLAVVEGTPRPGFSGQPPAAAPTPAQVIHYAPERVVLRATARRPGVLVLNDAFFPGWSATVDGRPVPIVRTNYLVRGVLLSAGTHRVVFSYPVPVSLVAGAAISVLGLALALGLAIGFRRAR